MTAGQCKLRAHSARFRVSAVRAGTRAESRVALQPAPRLYRYLLAWSDAMATAYISGLPPDTTSQDLSIYFSHFATIALDHEGFGKVSERCKCVRWVLTTAR